MAQPPPRISQDAGSGRSPVPGLSAVMTESGSQIAPSSVE
jgi:hypothetical protein